jgi:dTDP-4-amino-4,6-dideoxygalactose transaminase
MKMKNKSFKNPIYVTRPILPDLKIVNKELKEIWQSKKITNMGGKHDLLTEKLKGVLGVENLSLFNNGTIALIAAIKSLCLSGKVITTRFTFPATIHALTWNNLEPVFCDIDYKTMNIDVGKIEKLITHETSAILAVHMFGNPCDVKRIQAIANKYKLKIIYDAAHAFQVEIGGRAIGNFGDVSMFSFHATKLFHTIEGGAVVSRSIKNRIRIDLLRNFGIKKPEKIVLPGINGKMNEIQAAIGLVVLGLVEKEREKRKKIVAIYKKYFNDVAGIILPEQQESVKQNFQYFVIRIDQKKFGLSRDEVFEKLNKYNIYPSKYFFPLCSDYPHYRNLKSANNKLLPNAHKVSKEVLAMPLYGDLSFSDVEKICKIFISFKNI